MADKKLVGPGVYLDDGVSLKTAVEWLQKRIVEGETVISTSEVIYAHPFDAALALKKAFERRYGFLPLDPDNRPTMLQVPNGVGTTVEVPWGKYLIPNTDGVPGGMWEPKANSGYLIFRPTVRNGRMVLEVSGKVKMAQREHVLSIVHDAQAIVAKESIYRNKVIKVNFNADPDEIFESMPQFVAVGGVTERDLILPREVEDLVGTALWTPIEYPAQVKAAGVPTKRGVLLEGPPGTGKTLTLNLAAQKAQVGGATVLYLEDVTHLASAVSFMQDYGRGVIIAEDVERVMTAEGARVGGRSQNVTNLLNALDGIQAKGSELMVILTTNFVDTLDQALLRPGRFDAVVPVRAPDAETVVKLMKHFGRGLIDPGADLREAAKKMDGQIPAVIREVVERAKLAQIRRTKGQGGDGLLSGADLNVAAHGMLHHLNLLAPKAEERMKSGAEHAAEISVKGLQAVAEAIAGKGLNLAPYRNGQAKEAGNAGPAR